MWRATGGRAVHCPGTHGTQQVWLYKISTHAEVRYLCVRATGLAIEVVGVCRGLTLLRFSRAGHRSVAAAWGTALVIVSTVGNSINLSLMWLTPAPSPFRAQTVFSTPAIDSSTPYPGKPWSKIIHSSGKTSLARGTKAGPFGPWLRSWSTEKAGTSSGP